MRAQKRRNGIAYTVIVFFFAVGTLFFTMWDVMASSQGENGTVWGELKKWHRITITFNGPETSESANPNPFLNYRLNVTFSKGDREITVPGYYAADGYAADSSADQGNVWRVHFCPNEEGIWKYRASFRTGERIATSLDPLAGVSTAFDGARGSFAVDPSDKEGRDFRAKGLLRFIGSRYLQFSETKDFYLKGGADSPENLLAYVDFDQTEFGGRNQDKKEGEADHNQSLHRYEPHAKDWKRG